MTPVESEKKQGLDKEYFRWLINQNFETSGLEVQSDEVIDKAIERTQGLVKEILEASFRLRDFQSIAREYDLAPQRVQQLYAQAIKNVSNLIKNDLVDGEVNTDENN
jgi:DNA primase